MAVDEGVQARGVGDDFLRGPGLGGGIIPQVAQSDDVVSLLGGGVDGLLHGGIEGGAVLAGGDAVDVLAIRILEVGGGGLGEGLRRGDAHEGHLGAVHVEDLVALQHGITGDAVLLMVEVAGDVGELGLLDGGQGAGHAVVELVVAQGGDVIARGVHQLNDGLALVHAAVGGALDVVTGIHQQDLLASLLVVLLHGGDGRVAEGFVDVGVDVVGVDHRDLGLCRGGRDFLRPGGDGQREHHHHRQKQSEQSAGLLHDRFTSSNTLGCSQALPVYHAFPEKETGTAPVGRQWG